LIIVKKHRPADPAVDPDIAALKEAGLLRGSAMRVIHVLG
jgi:hypothetical protein